MGNLPALEPFFCVWGDELTLFLESSCLRNSLETGIRETEAVTRGVL